MKTKINRKIVFDLNDISEEILKNVGVYKILNKIICGEGILLNLLRKNQNS